MKKNNKLIFSFLFVLLTACTNGFNKPDSLPLALGNFTENDVSVSVKLERDENGQYFLTAVFTPSLGFHLYSKDIPLTGVDGLGRPTLLALSENSRITIAGELIENKKSQIPNFEPKELFVYPIGDVKLSLPIYLPPGNHWFNEIVLVTYMACNEVGCKPPVMQKAVLIYIPSMDVYQ